MKFTMHVTRLMLIAVTLVVSAYAQQRNCIDLTLQPEEPSSHMKKGVTETADRVVGVRPSQTVDTEQAVCPLTNKEKLHVFLSDSYSPYNMLAAGFNAAILQASQGRSGYGQGWDAYGARFGAQMADGETSGFFQTFFFPALLHQDSRYFRMREGPIIRRGFYAATRVFVTHNDNGHHQFNYSEVLGAFASSGISNAYYPKDQRDVGDFAYRAGLGVVTDAGWNLLKEFGPDIRRAFSRKNKTAAKDQPKSQPAQPSPGYQNVPRP